MATLERELGDGRAATSRDEEAGRRGGFRYGRYFLYVFLFAALLYPLPFVLVRLPSYERWSASQWGPMLEYSFETRPQNADVVIFGDSSAFLGIDPRVVNAKLGVHSIVMPDTVGSIPVTGDEPLKNYLQHNRAPRLLVLYFSPWNLDFDQTANGRLFEGEEMMLRHMSWKDVGSFERRHPTELPEFPFRLYSTFGPKIVKAALGHVDRERTTAEALGHVDYTEPFAPLKPSCVIPPEYLRHTADASVQALVRRYSTAQTRVLVYLAPIPDCRGSQLIARRVSSALGVAPPALLPPAFFAGDPYYAHIEPAFVRTNSVLFASSLEQPLRDFVPQERRRASQYALERVQASGGKPVR